MKEIALTALFLLVSSTALMAQKDGEAILVDEFGKLCSEDIMARLDNFINQLNARPDAKGVVLLYGDEETEGRNIFIGNYLVNLYPSRRGADPSRLSLVRGRNRAEQMVQFWLVPAGVDVPNPVEPFIENHYKATTLFDRSWIGFHRPYRKLEIYDDSFYDLGCGFAPNQRAFSATLEKDPTLKGFVVVYTKPGESRKQGSRLASFALNQFLRDHKIARSRISAVYGGIRKTSQVEFWIVPKGGQPQQKAPDKK